MGAYDHYTEHFSIGMKVNVGIPVPGGSVFHDWAIINDIDEDLLELQLSRDVLPDGVLLSMGIILDIRGGKDNNGYSCRAIIVTEGRQRELLLRLIGEIVSDELREFYRIDAFLPIKYFISTHTSERRLREDWIAKREARAAAELERKQHEKKPWQRLMLPQHEEQFPQEELEPSTAALDETDLETEEEVEDTTADNSWDDVIPLAANISGGGLRILLHHQFRVDDLMVLEIYVPTEPQPRIIDAVGRVVLCTQNYAASKQLQRESFNTSIEFLFIDERDRDCIVKHISNVQLKRIRQLREQYLGRNIKSDKRELSDAELLQAKIFRALLALVVIILLSSIVVYFKKHAENRPKGEIELIFEKGFFEYLKKTGRQPPTPAEP
jgi:hypothetical protein